MLFHGGLQLQHWLCLLPVAVRFSISSWGRVARSQRKEHLPTVDGHVQAAISNGQRHARLLACQSPPHRQSKYQKARRQTSKPRSILAASIQFIPTAATSHQKLWHQLPRFPSYAPHKFFRCPPGLILLENDPCLLIVSWKFPWPHPERQNCIILCQIHVNGWPQESSGGKQINNVMLQRLQFGWIMGPISWMKKYDNAHRGNNQDLRLMKIVIIITSFWITRVLLEMATE